MKFTDLNEGIFGGLRNAFNPSTKTPPLTLASSVKDLYKDPKIQAELGEMIKELSGIIKDFNDIDSAASEVIRRDVELNKAFVLMKDVLTKTVQMVKARKAVEVKEALAPPQYAIKRISGTEFEVTKFDGGDVPAAQHHVTKRGAKFFSDSPGYHKAQQEEKSIRLVKQFLADGEPKGAMYEADGDIIRQIKGLR